MLDQPENPPGTFGGEATRPSGDAGTAAQYPRFARPARSRRAERNRLRTRDGAANEFVANDAGALRTRRRATEIDGAAYERAVALPYRTGSGKAGVLAGPESGPRGNRLMPRTLPKGSPTMFRQYGPGNRFRYEVHGGRVIPVGTVRAGEVLHTTYGKVLVLAWKPREIAAARGRESRFMARLGHIALVRDLSTDPCSRPPDPPPPPPTSAPQM